MEDNTQSTEGIYQGCLQLVGAIFRLCAQDVKYGKTYDVVQFVESEWFQDLCDSLDVPSEEVKKKIFSSKVRQRAEYRS